MISKSMKTLVLFSGVLCSSCQKPSAPQPVVDDMSFRQPTATELFNLRTKCAELGEKINNDNVLGRLPMLMQTHMSHYDPKTNRCYVEVTVVVNVILWALKPEQDEQYQDYIGRYLFDGQTDD